MGGSAPRWGTLPLLRPQDGANDEPLIVGHTPRGPRGVTRQPQPSYGIFPSDGRVPRARISAIEATRAPFSPTVVFSVYIKKPATAAPTLVFTSSDTFYRQGVKMKWPKSEEFS